MEPVNDDLLGVDAPTFLDTGLSSKKRAALYLYQAVGEGNRFLKTDLRDAVPGVEQIDRRMRDLRDDGWIIKNYRDDPTLAPNELLLEKVGTHVWDPTAQKKRERAISAATRRQVFDRDSNCCVVCGIGAGEEYVDRPGTRARMTIGHVLPRSMGGSDAIDNLRTECAMCNETARDLTATPVDPARVLRLVRELPRSEKRLLAKWSELGRRDFTEAERIWAQLRQIPLSARKEIDDHLRSFR